MLSGREGIKASSTDVAVVEGQRVGLEGGGEELRCAFRPGEDCTREFEVALEDQGIVPGIGGGDEGVLAVEVVVEKGCGDPCPPSDLLDPKSRWANFLEDREGSIDDQQSDVSIVTPLGRANSLPARRHGWKLLQSWRQGTAGGSNLPAGLIDAPGFIEKAALRTGEGERLVGPELAPLGDVVSRGLAPDVVPTIFVHSHTSIMPRVGETRGLTVGSVRVVERMIPERVLRRWSESLAAVAKTGLGFTESLYEKERFEEILKIAADIKVATEEDPEQLDDAEGHVVEWMSQVGKGVPGYQTPKVAVGAAVENDKGELLLIRRADSGVWLYPTGWCDVGYSAAEVVEKEVEEETGIEVETVRLIAVLDGLRLGMSRIPIYSLLFHCRAVGGALTPHPLEVSDLGWFTQDDLPSPLVGLERWGDAVFSALRGEINDVHYDQVRAPVWRGDEAGA